MIGAQARRICLGPVGLPTAQISWTVGAEGLRATPCVPDIELLCSLACMRACRGVPLRLSVHAGCPRFETGAAQ